MDERLYLIDLYDTYGELLKDIQKEYFESYYFDNLSLGEISENMVVSRNAVHKQIKAVEEKLNFFEEKLKLCQKTKELRKIIDEISDKDLKEKLESIGR